MVSNDKHAMTPVVRLQIIFGELRSQRAFEVACSPPLAAMLDFNRHFAGGGGGGDYDVRLIAYGDLGLTEGVDDTMGFPDGPDRPHQTPRPFIPSR
jgi:hypothetical protein